MKHLAIGFLAIILSLVRLGETIIDDSLPSIFLTLDLQQKQGILIDSRQTVRHTRRLQHEGSNYSFSEMLPLFQGMGTHYSYIYVGTPPQRVSVIVDTGSHHTAFPCTGCNCGKHMDPSFDPERSNTSKIMQCLGKRCYFQQSYSEGSSWHAYKVADRLWMGGESARSIAKASDYSVNFHFGCQDSETGLFRTQHVDGIMGLSASEDTIPHQLVSQGIIKSRIFAMCFSIGGGILTLGGVDQSMHNPSEEILYAKLLKSKGWFTVRLLDISLRASVDSQYHKKMMEESREKLEKMERTEKTEKMEKLEKAEKKEKIAKIEKENHDINLNLNGNLNRTLEGMRKHERHGKGIRGDKGGGGGGFENSEKQNEIGSEKESKLYYSQSIKSSIPHLNGKKGVIVDSGTTDTYLPIAVKRNFEEIFKRVSDGHRYSNNDRMLTQAQVDRLPTIVYRIEGTNGLPVTITNPPSSYVENLGGGRYAFRVYLTEASGAVLGANVMNSHNVIFDIDGRRVGFIPSTCKYNDKKESLHVSAINRKYSAKYNGIGTAISDTISSFTAGFLGT